MTWARNGRGMTTQHYVRGEGARGLKPSVLDGGVDTGEEVEGDVGWAGRTPGRVGHQDGRQLFGGIVAPDRAEAAVPAVLPDRCGRVVAAGHDSHTEAPAA